MRIIRVLLLLVLAGAIAGIAVPKAKALGYEDEPCPPQPQLKVCHPDAEVGKPYSLQIHGKGGCTPDSVVYSIVGGALPTGLSVSSSTALVSGVPTQAGVYQFWLQVSDIPQWEGGASWCQDDKQSQWQFQITVTQGLQIVQRQSVLTPAQRTKPYSLQLSASGGGSGLTWSVNSGSLPAGLNLDSSTGLISGTPTAAADSQFQIKVTDGTRSDVQTYTLLVVDPLAITTPSPAAAELGLPFKLQLSASGGRAPYTWSATGLPSGFTLDPATGLISGTPGVVVTDPVQVTVTDALGLTSTQDVSLPVVARVTIAKKALPKAKVGALYNARLVTLGGVAPFRWRLVAAAFPSVGAGLPRGITLNASTGRLSGVPRKAGTYRFRVLVTDKLGARSSLGFVLKVSAAGAGG
jgi:putative Ig domain-containing protein